MIIILSQKIDTESDYSDELFNTYHYPARYKNQIHEGDTFIYYQGNRYCREQRYYFGVGTIGEILSVDGENYYAKVLNGQRFEKKVPIYLPDGGYVEQLGYETIRKSPVPPWQSSIRPLSEQAFDYILGVAGIQFSPNKNVESVEALKEKLKESIRSFYRDNNDAAILEIESVSSALSKAMNILDESAGHQVLYVPVTSPEEKVQALIEYCRTTRMNYSYKMVLLMLLFKNAGKDGCLNIDRATVLFKEYYEARRQEGMIVEKKPSIVSDPGASINEIKSCLINNPVKALATSGFFFYNNEEELLSVSPDIWPFIGRSEKITIGKICRARLKDYYGE